MYLFSNTYLDLLTSLQRSNCSPAVAPVVLMAYSNYVPSSGNLYSYGIPLLVGEDVFSVGSGGQSQWQSIPRTIDPSAIMTRTYGPLDDSDASIYGSLGRSSNGSIRSVDSAVFDQSDSMARRKKQDPRGSYQSASPSEQ